MNQKRAQYIEDAKRKTPFRPQISPLKNRTGPLTARYREEQKDFENQWEYLHADGQKKNKNQKKDLTTDEARYLRE